MHFFRAGSLLKQISFYRRINEACRLSRNIGKLAGLSHIFGIVLCLLSLPGVAQVEQSLDQWRQQVAATRKLADNDPAKAYSTAQFLQGSLPANAAPSDRVLVMNVLARTEVYLAKTASAAEHARQALALAQQYNDQAGIVEAQLNIVINAINRGKVDVSVSVMADTMNLLQDIDRPELVSEAMLRMAMSYHRLNFMDEAITLALQNLEIAKQSNDLWALLYAYQGMAIVYEQSGRYQEAYIYYKQMRDAAHKVSSTLWEGHAIIGIAATLHYLDGDDLTEESLWRDAISLFRQSGFPFSLAVGLHNYATFLERQQRYDEADKVIRESIDIYQKYSNQIGLWYALNTYAENLEKLNREEEAHEEIAKAYQLAVVVGFPKYIEDSARRMAKIAAKHGDYQKAYQYVSEAKTMNKQYTLEKANNRIVQLTERYKTESKQRQIDKLNLQAERQKTALEQQKLRQRLLWTVLGAITLLLTASIWFTLRSRRSNRELIKLNREVELSQSKLMATLDAIPDLLFVLNIKGEYLEFHSPFTNLLIAPAEQLLGNTVFDVLPEEAAGTCMDAIHEARDQGVSTGKQVELPLTDGNRWFELSVSRKSLLPDEDQQFIILSRDITERKRMEQALMKSEQEFRALVENSPDGIVRYDVQGRQTFVNQTVEKLMGENASILMGKTLEERSFIDNYDEYSAYLKQVINTGKEARLQVQTSLDGGKKIYSDIRFCPEFNVEGKVTSVLAVGRDITQLKEAEQKIEEAYTELRELAVRRDEELEEERKRIARDMHDELGQYLTTLRMNISVLRMQFGSAYKKLDGQLSSMMMLLDKTIHVVRKIASQLRPSQLQMGVIAALEWLVEEHAENTGIRCVLEKNCDEIPMSDSCATAIFRIVQESLTNVARYAQATEVKVVLNVDGRGYSLVVRDNGIGFDPDKMQKKSFGMLGMKERAANLGGEVTITSSAGKGTIVEAFLPVMDVKEKDI